MPNIVFVLVICLSYSFKIMKLSYTGLIMRLISHVQKTTIVETVVKSRPSMGKVVDRLTSGASALPCLAL